MWLNYARSIEAAVLAKQEHVAFPKLPHSVYASGHAPLYDAFQMQQYAIRYSDAVLTSARVTKQDANNYSRILTLLGMEEEGDPVAEVARLKESMTEAAEILDTFVGNVSKGGNYSKETTLVFLGQVRQCLSNP